MIDETNQPKKLKLIAIGIAPHNGIFSIGVRPGIWAGGLPKYSVDGAFRYR